jgi:anaerobic selenocysteine-containing dehydrogenase
LDTNQVNRADTKPSGNHSSTEIRRTTCSICTRSCFVDAYIKDGTVIKVEGCSDPNFGGKPLCVKGQALRQYMYHQDRIKTPLKRIGPRGEGKFVPISWEEAYQEIAKKLNSYKADFGADSVVFYTGWSKWYRFMLHRLAYSFGSVNYGTESSSCFISTIMANKLESGYNCKPDLDNANVVVVWSMNHEIHPALIRKNETGLKVIVVDPRLSLNTQKYADIHLRIKPGTDAALAHGLARIFIHRGWIDHDYIEQHVYGYSEYAAYVEEFSLERVSELTGLSADEITAAANLIISNAPMAMVEGNTGMIHHKNGMQTCRAVNALSAITGFFDRKGGQVPSATSRRHSFLPDGLLNLEFIDEVLPDHHQPMIGTERFPLWTALNDEIQAMDFPRHVLEQKPYPLKALFSLGLNVRMFPDNHEFFRALETIDFFVDVDLFMTDSAKYADIVLPACTSLERSELLGVMGHKVTFVEPAIPAYYESISDVDIICELAEALQLEDYLLRSGYEACCRYIMRDLPFTLDQLKTSPRPLRIPHKPYEMGSHTAEGYDTPTGKYELSSKLIKQHPEWGLHALPTYADSLDPADPQLFPLILISGVRYPYLLHSRSGRLAWLRPLRPEPMADLNPDDAALLGLGQGDEMTLSTSNGSIMVKANLTYMTLRGTVEMYHGYSEADVNSIMPKDHYDPYTGYPGYKSVRCAVHRRST